MTARRDSAARELEAWVSCYRRKLLHRGDVVECSGSLLWADGLLAVHSDYGPPGQDKSGNQDYALAWVANGHHEEHRVQWTAAIADGVTSSFRPDWGAKLACWCALAHLAETEPILDPEKRAKQSMNAAGEALGSLAEHIAAKGDDLRPADEFPTTWHRRIERGRLLQTTLTLAWLEDELLNLAMVGDGGAAMRLSTEEQIEDKLIVGGEAEVAHVHALGPANQRVEKLDFWHRCPLTSGSTVTFYTDGIRAAVGQSPGQLLDQLTEMLQEPAEGNVAEALVRELADSGREELTDNLTLLVASRSRRPGV